METIVMYQHPTHQYGDPITLTLPIQRTLKHDQQSLPTPTPPGTPLLQLSPSKHYPNSTLSIFAYNVGLLVNGTGRAQQWIITDRAT